MAFKRMKPVRRAASAPPSQFPSELRHAAKLIEQERWDDAMDFLEDLHHRYPTKHEPLEMLAEVGAESGDMMLYEDALNQLIALAPDTGRYYVARAGGSMNSGLMALGLLRFKQFLERWPDHPEAEKVRKTVRELEPELSEIMEAAGLPPENRLELAALNDETQLYLQYGRYEEARKRANEVLKQNPNYAPALNNISMTYSLEGEYQQAIDNAQRVLEFAPDNIHALANLARCSYLLGRTEEAQAVAERLKASEAFGTDKSIKIAETLSFLGDDAGVAALYDHISRSRQADLAKEEPLFAHLAAVALYRTGREKEAQKAWKQALKLDPDFELAEENLEDLRLPVGERNGPWAYTLNYWMPAATSRDLIAFIGPPDVEKSEGALTRDARVFLDAHPEMRTIVPALLERGDPGGREFALMLASAVKDPELLAAVRDFALSQNGPDDLRFRAANMAKETGLIEADKVRMWREGTWQELMLMNWEIHTEVLGNHSPRVEKMAEQAYHALRNLDGKKAETILKQALEIEPDAPDLLNNLSGAYRVQNRIDEATELVLQVYDRFPDYFFGKVGMAHLWLQEGQIEDAERILTPLLSQKRMHMSEFAALAQAQVELLLAKGEEDGARNWLGMWEQVYPDHPGLMQYHLRFLKPDQMKPGVMKRLFGG